MLTIRHIDSLIQQRNERPIVIEAWAGRTLSELAPDGAQMAVVNDRVFKRGEDDWGFIPADGATVCFVAVPADLTTALVITGAILLSIGATVTLGPIYLNLLFPDAGPTPGLLDNKQTATYGFDAIENQTANGSTIPVVYGRHKVGGMILQAWRSAAPDGRSQIIHIQIALSRGPIAACGHLMTDNNKLRGVNIPLGMTINGMDARTIKGVIVSNRLGAAVQSAMPGFKHVNCEYPYDFRLTSDSASNPFTHKTKDPCRWITLLVAFPRGLFKINKSGKIKGMTVTIGYRVYLSDGETPVTGSRSISFGDRIQAPLYKQIRVTGLNPSTTANGRPEFVIKAWRIGAEGRTDKNEVDQCNITGVVETQAIALTYPGLALIGVSIPATDKISGGTPRINTMIHGRKVDVWTGAAYAERYSANPAWIHRDLAVEKSFGLGNKLATTDIDDASFDDAADYHDEVIERYTGSTAAVTSLAGTCTAAAFSGGIQVVTRVSGAADYRAGLRIGDVIAFDNPATDTAQVIEIISESVFWIDAALSTTAGRTVFKQNGLERRHRWDGVLDSARAGWEALGMIGSSCRTAIYKIGNRIKAKLENQSIPFQTFRDTGEADDVPAFGGGSIRRGSFTLSYVNPEERNNVVEVQFRNREKDYENDFDVVDAEGMSEGSDSIRKRTVPLIGVTSPYQARRIAEYVLRQELRIAKTCSIEVGVEAIAIEPLDVFLVSSDATDWGISGRLAGTSGGNIQIDQDYTFVSGVLYEYREISALGEIDSFDFVHTGTTDTLTFAPLFTATGDDPVLGRRYFLGRKFANVRPFRASRLVSIEGGNARRIEGVEYLDGVYSDSGAAAAVSIAPVATSTPAAVVIAPPVVETSTEAGYSILTMAWDSTAADAAAAGDGTTVELFNVYWKRYGDETWEFAGETEDDTFEFESTLPMGTVIAIAVQTVNADGSVLDIDAATDGDDNFVAYLMQREGDGTELIKFPADVANFTLTVAADNTYTLAWDAVTLDTNGDAMTIGGYEVRIGNWASGKIIYNSTGTSTTVELDQVAHRFYIRAWKAAGNGYRYYSGGATNVESTAVAVPGYGTQAGASVATYDSATGITLSAENDGYGSPSNGAWVEWFFGAPNPEALVQIFPDALMSFVSNIADLGSSAATQVSVDCRAAPYWGDELEAIGLRASMLHWSPFGEINKDYIEWAAYVEYADSASGPWAQVNVKDNAGLEIVATARYFRLRFEGRFVAPALIGVNDYEPTGVRAMIERFVAAFFRAP